MATVPLATERLVSADSPVHCTDQWIKARLSQRLHSVWDEADRKLATFEASELRRKRVCENASRTFGLPS